MATVSVAVFPLVLQAAGNLVIVGVVGFPKVGSTAPGSARRERPPRSPVFGWGARERKNSTGIRAVLNHPDVREVIRGGSAGGRERALVGEELERGPVPSDESDPAVGSRSGGRWRQA